MHLNMENIHGLNVPRDLVYAAMTDLNSDSFKMSQRGNKSPKEKGTFFTRVFKIAHFQSPSMVLSILQVENYSGSKRG